MVLANVDPLDLRILQALQKDGRASIQDISESVGLSPSPVARRLKMMEKLGILTGYTALIDEAALGYGFSVFLSIKLDKQVDDTLAQFESAIAMLPEVVDCWLMTGNRDYLLRIATSGLPEFERFLVGKFTKLPGVASIESSIPLRRVKSGQTRLR
jgi:Lrp/AsnC family leucine-responsive transcriptional regulator